MSGRPELLEFRLPPELEDFYVLSPYVIACDDGYEMLVRLVNRNDDASKKLSRIHCATSSDGLTFAIGSEAIGPGKREEPDGAGSEDPTITGNGRPYTVFYSGYNALDKVSSMLAATGTALCELRKTGPVLEPRDAYANPKEAAIFATSNGFRMLFEYARDGASLIGAADALRIEGPWRYGDSPLAPRADGFDSWHLSPACGIRRADGTHVLIYNGASKEAAWRINFAQLDAAANVVLDRPLRPLIEPHDLDAGDTDIAFAASAVLERPGSVYLTILSPTGERTAFGCRSKAPRIRRSEVRRGAGSSTACSSAFSKVPLEDMAAPM